MDNRDNFNKLFEQDTNHDRDNGLTGFFKEILTVSDDILDLTCEDEVDVRLLNTVANSLWNYLHYKTEYFLGAGAANEIYTAVDNKENNPKRVFK